MIVAAWVLNAIGTLRTSCWQNVKRSAQTLLEVPCLFHTCSGLIFWFVVFVIRYPVPEIRDEVPEIFLGLSFKRGLRGSNGFGIGNE
jgi:hypothetical protein